MAQSTAWKQLEKKVASFFQEHVEDYEKHAIVRRNVRGNDFGQKDSDVDLINMELLSPYSFIVDCKYRAAQNTWLVKTFKERLDQFKKNKGPEYNKLGNQEFRPVLQLTVFLKEEEHWVPYYCVSLEDFPRWWSYLEMSGSPHTAALAFHNEIVYARPNQKFLADTIQKIRKEYFPLKSKECIETSNAWDHYLVPVVAQRLPKSPLIVLLIPVEDIEEHHRHGDA